MGGGKDRFRASTGQRVDSEFLRLIEHNARLWAGEAEVVRSYFISPRRTRASDLLWIERQAFKELRDGVQVFAERCRRGLDEAEMLRAELEHFRIFSALHEALRGPADAALDPETLRQHGDWPENAALRALRAEHVARHGPLGERAQRFTEGGYATLFSEGAKLRGRGGADDRIADACKRVLADELEHMRSGIAGLAHEGLDAAEWCVLTEISTAQLRARIHMRSAQFGHPLPSERIAALCAGACAPLAFRSASP